MATTDMEPLTDSAEPPRPPALRDRLAPPIPGSRLIGWLGPLVIAVFAAVLRFTRLDQPKAVVFDETYYAKDALALLKFGYEHNTVKDADKLLIEQPGANIWSEGAAFVAHPPAGKWMIAIGEHLFGATPFGWRFVPALIGALSVLVLARVARRMTGSTLLGCAAGLLLALDGLHFVTSRAALLDIFVMFWVLCGFACLVADRDRARRTLAGKVEAGGGTAGFGPFVMHWWRLAAGVCLGLACATKWTGIFYIAAFGLMVVLWDMGARRAAGVRRPYTGALVLEAVPAFFSLVGVALVTYLATWSGWIFAAGGWGRGKVAGFVLARPFEALPDLWNYHLEMWNFHTHLDATHPYQSWPWNWPILFRPVVFFYQEPKGTCGAERCSQEILGIGTVAIWWASLAALAAMVLVWLIRRDWRAGAVVLGYLAGWLPWFPSALADRTMFLFYATPLLPFMILAIVLALGMIIGPEREPGPRRVVGAAVAGGFVLVVLANFAYIYPVLSAHTLAYDDWLSRMWFKTWI
ncbi:phospholipid carrier-dependent glycosyltransferase [Actinomadura craniellae]|uniref:Polyprenol-phosphate-mannose--protein mannosyltransferase n=1 Tax=Actinomadura craniellae TaxID=2231787 RepID=A0A365H1Z4_9ACTN|nr:phospholipid carrier-dependent glycosyltransferase [Actinomadura craniellae]RAY12233.1 phospholipid carrier-dependent glycosyltransferase [Actinomadura craniellae]